MSNVAKGAKKKAKKGSGDPREAKTVVARNRRARHDFHIYTTYEAGLALTGTEVKSLRAGRASLIDGWVDLVGGEAWLENVHIPEYTEGTWTNHAPRRRRKLLLHHEQIVKLSSRSREKGYTVVPLELYFRQGRAKVEIGLAKGKQEWDKRQALREKQDLREAQRAMSLRQHR